MASPPRGIAPPEIEMLVEDTPIQHSENPPSVPRRKRCVLAFSSLILLAVSIGMIVFFTSGRNDQGEVPQESESDNFPASTIADEEPTENVTTAPPTTLATPGTTTVPPCQDNATIEPSILLDLETAPPTQEDTLSTTLDDVENSGQDVSVWMDATVTLQSGVMYEVLDYMPHDPNAFTQGLTYDQGRLFESTGLYRKSTTRQLDPSTGETLVSRPLPDEYFGEGMTYMDGKLVQITWREQTAFVWNADDLLEEPEEYSYQTTNSEGWGITYDQARNELIVSDGSANLIFWDPITLTTLRTMSITRHSGLPASNMNELEFWRGRILANVWYEDVILVIHPETGEVEKEYDFSELYPDRPRSSNVFNGISISADPDVLYVTGKRWDRMYRIRLLPG